MEARTEMVTVAGGGFAMPLWVPGAGRGPGILLIQEIYGVGPYIRQVAEDLSEIGYVVGAPDLFWRLSPGYQAAHDEAGTARSLEMGARFDFEQGVADAVAALAHLRAQPEVDGPTGIVGFCFGGSVGYVLAARAEPDALVAMYGSALPDMTDLMDSITCPALCVFGGSDPYIPRDKVARVEEAAAGRPNFDVRVFEKAGHAFHNHMAPQFHDPQAAPVAWNLVATFLIRHLPVL